MVIDLFTTILCSLSVAANAFGPTKRPAFTGTFPWARVPTMMQVGFPGRFVRSNMTGDGAYVAACCSLERTMMGYSATHHCTQAWVAEYPIIVLSRKK